MQRCGKKGLAQGREGSCSVECRDGSFRCKTPDPKWNLIEKAPIVHSREEKSMFLITFLSE